MQFFVLPYFACLTINRDDKNVYACARYKNMFMHNFAFLI